MTMSTVAGRLQPVRQAYDGNVSRADRERLEPSILELFRGALARIFLYFRGFTVQLLY